MKKHNIDSYITPWGYVGYILLWTIPVLGWIIWIFACFSKRGNKRNYARSFILALIISIYISIKFAGAFFWGFMMMIFGGDSLHQESTDTMQSTVMYLGESLCEK